MSADLKFSSGLHVFGNTLDRFMGSGYKENRTLEELFESASKVKELSGVELIGGWHINEENVDKIKELKNKYNLEIVFIGPDLWTQKRWKNGSFASSNIKIRKDAIEVVKKTMDIAVEIDCDLLDVWFTHDGYDYSFQADFIKAWN